MPQPQTIRVLLWALCLVLHVIGSAEQSSTKFRCQFAASADEPHFAARRVM